MVKTETLEISTRGNCDIVDITGYVQQSVSHSGLTNGTVTILFGTRFA